MEIQLHGKGGGVAIVSEEDYSELSKYRWTQTMNGYVKGIINGKYISMHGLIKNAKDGEVIDHVNGLCYDNRRENLVISDAFKNARNRTIISR